MPYYIRTRDRDDPGVLVECSVAQAERSPLTHRRIDAQRAHKWVLGYGIHETLLYVVGVSTRGYPYHKRVIRRA